MRRLRLRRSVPCCVLALLPFVVGACESASPPPPADPAIEFVTPGGMHVRVLPDPGSGLFASNVFVGAGSTREQAASAGSSHFLEHLLFNGTERRTQEELYAEVDRIGAYNNATTKLEYTHYMMVAPSEVFERALDIQADMLLHSILPSDKFEKEQGIVLEEMSRDEDDPAHERREIITEALFGPESDFARPVLGTRESIAALDRDEVLAYYRQQYVPSNMKLLLMGDFDLANAKSTIERLFDAPAGAARPAPTFVPPTTSMLHRRTVTDDAITIALQLPAPALGHDDYAAVALLVDILGGGEASRLSRAFNDAADLEALEVSAWMQQFQGAGVINVETRLPLGSDADAALALLLREMATLASTGVRASEWTQARNRALSASIREIEQLHYYALMQGDRIWHGPAGFERRLQTAIETSYDRMDGAAQRWFGEPALEVVIVGPDQPPSDAPFDPADAGYIALADARTTSALPGGGILDDDRPLAASVQPPRVSTLENGLTVVHMASPSTRMFALHLLVRDRSAREPESLAGIADLLMRVLPQGAGNYDREEFAALLDGIGAEWKVTDSAMIPYDDYYATDPRFSFVRLDCVDLYWREAIRLLGIMLGEPHLDQEALDRARAEMLVRVGQDASQPARVAAEEFDAALLGNQHPLARPVFGTEQSLNAITRKDLQSFALDYLDPGQLVLAVVGNLDHDAVLAHLETQLRIGGASAHAMAEVPPLPLTTVDRGVTETVGGRQVALRMGRVVEIDPADRWALEVAVGIASQRMQQDLRETRGWAYSLGIGVGFQGDRARISASMGTQPQNAEAAAAAIREIFVSTEFTTTAEEIEAVVHRTLGRERMRRVTSIGKAYNLSSDLVFGGSLDFERRRSEGLRAVSEEDVTRVWGRYFGDRPLVTAVVD